MHPIGHPEASEYAEHYTKYMQLVPETDLLPALAGQLEETRRLILGIPATHQDVRFAPGEWNVKEIFGHILDSERLFGLRLLCFARGDTVKLEVADQDLYVRTAEFERYSIEDLVQEYVWVRQAHLSLLNHLPQEAWSRTGWVSGHLISVRALGYLMLGHERHHLITIREHYLGA